LVKNLSKLSNYPTTKGIPELREAIATWANKRFNLNTGSFTADKHVLPVNGTREALFAFAQAIVDRSKPNPIILSPNPFYQIYEGAAILSGAEPYFLNCTPENNFIPDFSAVSAEIWQRTQLLFITRQSNRRGYDERAIKRTYCARR
jgi:N-succinyldiaminopimelate aminotransferase